MVLFYWRGSASPEEELADSADKKQPVDSWKYSQFRNHILFYMEIERNVYRYHNFLYLGM